MISNQKKKFHFIYVLRSQKDHKLYVGYTNDLKSRFEQHKKGQVASTKNRRPLALIYSEACLEKRDAMHREIYLKTSYGKQFLRNRFKSYLMG